MATKSPNGVAKGAPAESTSDLAQMWQKAIEDYEKRTKTSLRLSPAKSMEEVLSRTETETKNFNAFRHDGGKADAIRTAFKNNLWLIQKVVNTVQVIGNAASAFPPAMPAALIFNAFGQVTQSFNNMSAEYDRIIGFFDFTRRFLDRLSMIEQRTPKLAPFQRCIVYVFSNMLTICAFAQEMAKRKRFKVWFETLTLGSDPALAGAYSAMEDAINELSQAVGLATLRSVEIIAEIVQSMNENIDILVVKFTNFQSTVDEGMQRLDTSTNIVIKQTQEVSTKQDQSLMKQDQMLEDLKTLKKYMHGSADAHERNLEKDRKPQLGQKKGKTDPGENKRVTLAVLQAHFQNLSPSWYTALEEAKAQRREIRDTSVAETGSWVMQEASVKQWTDWETPILWMSGSAGIGKTFLAQSIVTELETTSHDRSPFAYFFFREDDDRLKHFDKALYCLSYQLAESDSKYSEKLSIELASRTGEFDPWKTLFAERFPAKGDDHAYLVLDGIDEMTESSRKLMLERLDHIVKEDLNIHVLLTGRPDISSEIASLNPAVFDLTKDKLAADISKVINEYLRIFTNIRKFRKPVKSIIRKKIKSKADGMRYVDHMLRRLNYIGREKGVINDLRRNLPDSLEELYNLMLAECQANRTEQQYRTLKKLFAWLAYSKRALSLSEAGDLIALTVDDAMAFDLEDELIGRSARILELANGLEEEEDDGEADSKSEISDHSNAGTDINIQGSGKVSLSFQERSLREYFQAVDVDEHGLRTPPSAAHFTIFEMATDILFQATEIVDDKKQPEVLNYASAFWVKHLVEISLENASNEEVTRVVSILHKIMNNYKNVAVIFERFGGIVYSNMLYDDSAQWLKVVKDWVARATSSSSVVLDPDVETWANGFVKTETPLINLARGHITNWFTNPDGSRIYKAFEFARDALILSQVDVGSGGVETVLKIADHFPDLPKTAGAMRAMGAILHQMSHYDDSILWTSKGLAMLEEEPDHDPSLPFYLERCLSASHAGQNRHEEAVKEIDHAVQLLPPDWRDKQNLVEIVQWIYVEKANSLIALGKNDEAIQAFATIRTVRPDKTLDSWLLDEMVVDLLNSSSSDENRTKLLALLKDWSEKERISWFDEVIGENYTDSMEILNEMAARNGEEGKSFLLQSYNSYMATLSTKSDRMACARAALATTYRLVIGDNSMSKDLYKQVLRHNLHNPELRSSFDGILFEVRRALAQIFFEEFQTCSDLTKKVAILEELRGLATQRSDNNEYFELAGSNISVAVALMSRVVGQLTEYQTTLQKTFDNCINGLSDSVGWNDSTSFRLLAKVIGSVEGLERDALIALSCQFSQVTNETKDDEEEPHKDSNNEGTEKTSDTDEKENAPDNVAATTNDVSTDSETSPATTAPAEPHVKEPILVTETTISTATIEDGQEKERSTVTIEEASVSASHTPNPNNPETTAATDSTNEASTDPYFNEEKLAPNPDEEIAQDSPLTCDGVCKRSFSSWSVPMYFCLICTNSDLCGPCHAKRLAQNGGAKNDFWRSYCGKDHLYVKGPIKGWRGVKAGKFRIEGPDGLEEVEVREWLKELREVRWPKAWEAFWTRLEGARNIGF